VGVGATVAPIEIELSNISITFGFTVVVRNKGTWDTVPANDVALVSNKFIPNIQKPR
jgi:hypothetical protein